MQTFQELPAAQIRPSGTNDRQMFNDEALTDLAWSIKTNGLAQPITVRPVDGGFCIVAGERRFRAMTQILGYDTIPCLVERMDDARAAGIMLAENAARVALNPIEEATAYSSRIEQYGWSIDRVADTAGVSKEIVKKRVALLTLREEIQHLLRYDGLPLGHAEAMTDLDRNRQISALRILQQSKTPMPIQAFRDVCAELLAAQNQDTLFGLELTFSEQAAAGAGQVHAGKDVQLDVPVLLGLPPVIEGRIKGMTAAGVIEAYIRTLQASGHAHEAATIGTLYTALVANNYMKPRVRLALAETRTQEGFLDLTDAVA